MCLTHTSAFGYAVSVAALTDAADNLRSAANVLGRQMFRRAYDYDRHFGGGHYFFVRGVDARHGLFTFRPSLPEIEHWADLLGQQPA